jgi:hypothetical protein
MSAGEKELTTLWCEIDSLLARARAARPLHQSDALLDLDRLTANAAMPLLERLARAVDGWDGRLLLSATDDTLTPEVNTGDRLVIDPEREAKDGSLVVAFANSGLVVRRLRMRAGRQSLEADGQATIPLGPLVALVGVVVELRRALNR